MATKKGKTKPAKKPWWYQFVKDVAQEVETALYEARVAVADYDAVSEVLDKRDISVWNKFDMAASDLEDAEAEVRQLVDSITEKTEAFKKQFEPLTKLRAAIDQILKGEKPAAKKAGTVKPAAKKSASNKGKKSPAKKPAAARSTKKAAAKKSNKKPLAVSKLADSIVTAMTEGGKAKAAAKPTASKGIVVGKSGDHVAPQPSAVNAATDELLAVLRQHGASDATFVGRQLKITGDAARGRLERMTKRGLVVKTGDKKYAAAEGQGSRVESQKKPDGKKTEAEISKDEAANDAKLNDDLESSRRRTKSSMATITNWDRDRADEEALKVLRTMKPTTVAKFAERLEITEDDAQERLFRLCQNERAEIADPASGLYRARPKSEAELEQEAQDVLTVLRETSGQTITKLSDALNRPIPDVMKSLDRLKASKEVVDSAGFYTAREVFDLVDDDDDDAGGGVATATKTTKQTKRTRKAK